MADNFKSYSLFFIDGKTVMGKSIDPNDTSINTAFPDIDKEKYTFIQNPATVEFSIQQTAATSAATMSWKIMPFVPKFVKFTQGDAYIFAIPNDKVSLCNKPVSSLIASLQSAYTEIA